MKFAYDVALLVLKPNKLCNFYTFYSKAIHRFDPRQAALLRALLIKNPLCVVYRSRCLHGLTNRARHTAGQRSVLEPLVFEKFTFFLQSTKTSLPSMRPRIKSPPPATSTLFPIGSFERIPHTPRFFFFVYCTSRASISPPIDWLLYRCLTLSYARSFSS